MSGASTRISKRRRPNVSWLMGRAALLAALLAAPARGQEATERYIPLGRSPGLSGELTSIGEIAEADPRARTLTLTLVDARGTHTVKITERTRIYLDRTKLKQSNLTGSFDDLRKGRRAEVKYADPAQKQAADWVKVEITQP
jgi:hypothetical protein